VIQTDRLFLRHWRDGDLEPLARINTDPEVTRYLRDGRAYTRDETVEMIGEAERTWERHGFMWWAAELKATGQLVGGIGLSIPTFLPEVLPAVEVGWRLDRAHWGQGLATEGGRASLRFGFETLGLERILSIRQAANDRSRRVMEKLDIRFVRETVHPGHGRRLAIHAVTAEEWGAAQPA
jgi:RimJ/RimL family protein N-acetyltransferase